MLKNLFEDLRIRYAIWRYGITKQQQHDLAKAFHAVETLRGLGPDVDIQARLRQATLLEAHDVPEELVNVLCKVRGEGRLTRDTLNQIAQHGIRLEFHLDPTMREQIRDMAKVERLQHAVKRLAFIAGPGFTTDHLVSEGIVQEGDL